MITEIFTPRSLTDLMRIKTQDRRPRISSTRPLFMAIDLSRTSRTPALYPPPTLQLWRRRSNCERRHQLLRSNSQREPLNRRSHSPPEKSGSVGRIKLSACNHDDRIINWSGLVRITAVEFLSCPRATQLAAMLQSPERGALTRTVHLKKNRPR
jgi:hypothetical protein